METRREAKASTNHKEVRPDIPHQRAKGRSPSERLQFIGVLAFYRLKTKHQDTYRLLKATTRVELLGRKIGYELGFENDHSHR